MSYKQSVEYLLVAEFDIDKGPTVSHQYPEALASDVKQLAELMLPDQMHVRTEDWTIFFLHFTPVAARRRTLSNASDMQTSSKELPLMYVLNLVNTKHDKEAKRGAQVQALAIVTRHSFLHIYKPILLLALDEYARSPTVATLATLFKSVNSMDLSDMPKLTHVERLILLASEREDLFGDRLSDGARSRSESNSSQLSHLSDRVSDFIISPTTSFNLPSPTMTLVRDTHHHSSSISYNGTVIPIKVPLTILPEIVGDFSMIQLINTFSKPVVANASVFPLHAHLTTNGPNTHPLIVLMNGLLSQKRIVFLGRGRPSGEVAGNVLAACAMASGGSGLLRGFTQRAFPYTDLSKIDDLLTVDGFIAGVTNSVFELHPEWWDLLCNTETGQITISSQIKSAEKLPLNTSLFATNGEPKGNPGASEFNDITFVEDLLLSIEERASESVIRLKFRDFIFRFVRMAGCYEEAVYGASSLLPDASHFHLPGYGWVWQDEQSRRRDLAACASRALAWRDTDSYQNYVEDIKMQYARSSSGVRTFDLWLQIEKLRSLRTLTEDNSAYLYKIMRQEIITDAHLTELLSFAPFSTGGLTFLGQGLLHPDQETRKNVVYLLDKIREHTVGKHFFAAMMRYHRMTFQRLFDELDRENDEND